MKSKTELRKENNQFREGLKVKGRCMKRRVPKHYFLPAINLLITAGQEAKAIRDIRAAYNQNPEAEFKQSFQSWSPRSAKDIIRWEIIPMIHERINIRPFLKV